MKSASTFSAADNYRVIDFHQDRVLLDSELNEVQEILDDQRSVLFTRLFGETCIEESGSQTPSTDPRQITFTAWRFLHKGFVCAPHTQIVAIPAGVQTDLPLYLEIILGVVTKTEDATLVDPETSLAVAERQKLTLNLTTTDPTGQALPTGGISRTVVTAFTVDQNTLIATPALSLVPSATDVSKLYDPRVYAADPTPGVAWLGRQIIVRASGQPDILKVCLRNVSGTYEWVALGTGSQA